MNFFFSRRGCADGCAPVLLRPISRSFDILVATSSLTASAKAKTRILHWIKMIMDVGLYFRDYIGDPARPLYD